MTKWGLNFWLPQLTRSRDTQACRWIIHADDSGDYATRFALCCHVFIWLRTGRKVVQRPIRSFTPLSRNVISTRCFHGHRLSGALIEMHLTDVQLARMKWCWWCLMKRLIETLNALSSRRHVKESVHDIVRWTREIVINYANDDLNDTRHTFLRAAKSLKRRSSRETFRSSIKRVDKATCLAAYRVTSLGNHLNNSLARGLFASTWSSVLDIKTISTFQMYFLGNISVVIHICRRNALCRATFHILR